MSTENLIDWLTKAKDNESNIALKLLLDYSIQHIKELSHESI